MASAGRLQHQVAARDVRGQRTTFGGKNNIARVYGSAKKAVWNNVPDGPFYFRAAGQASHCSEQAQKEAALFRQLLLD